MSCCGPIRTSAAGHLPPQRATGALTLPICQRSSLVFLKKLVAVLLLLLALVMVMADDPQDLDEAEGGSQPPQGRLLVGVDLSLTGAG